MNSEKLHGFAQTPRMAWDLTSLYQDNKDGDETGFHLKMLKPKELSMQ
jgi:hypothetical protein